jgi:hypothetical protein
MSKEMVGIKVGVVSRCADNVSAAIRSFYDSWSDN